MFITVLDVILIADCHQNYDINWKLNTSLGELPYADDIMFLSNRYSKKTRYLTDIANSLNKAGLQININKTKAMRMNTNNNMPLII